MIILLKSKLGYVEIVINLDASFLTDDIFIDPYVNTITTSYPYDLPLVYLELIDWDQQGSLALDICFDDNSLLALLNMNDLEEHIIVNRIQLHGEAYFGSNFKSLSCKSEKKNPNSPGENLNEASSDTKKSKKKGYIFY